VIERPTDRRLPLPPPMAMRVAWLSGLAFLLFAVMLFRLWFLQVLSGPQYVQLANNNRVRDIPIAAPRGQILDRNGNPIVANATASAVQLIPQRLPPDRVARHALYVQLGGILGMRAGDIAALVDSPENFHFADVTIQTQVSQAAVVYLKERAAMFPEVNVEPIEVRQYPYGDLAAQVLGNIGQVNAQELGQQHFRGVTQGTIVGQAGIEYEYDRYLRGRNGADRVQVDSQGHVTNTLGTTLPISGHDLRLTLDLDLQKEGEQALAQGIGLAQANGNAATAGAFVALDPNSGQVLALGSSPTYDPSIFTKPIPDATYKRLFGGSSDNPGPQFDRAIEGGYPTGSTFKPITALAGLESGVITPYTTQGGGQCIVVGLAHQKFCNSGHADYGDLDLVNALRVSEDTYFYRVGEEANGLPGEVIQSWARKLGLGEPTGIDLPNEAAGIIPDRAWRAQRDAEELACEQKRHVPSCEIADGRPWSVGDNINFSVGQGDLEASPLQMAVAYSAIVNGGNVWRPHVAQEIDDSQGNLVQTLSNHLIRHVNFDPAYQQAIMQGLHAATSQPGGTSADVFAGWPQSQYPVYGKTGTAQHTGQDDQSWYVCYVPAGKRSIVIAVTIEKGGFGAQAAAPAARLMLSEWFHQPLKLVEGSSSTL
jgi:penicillin-binding protein 2